MCLVALMPVKPASGADLPDLIVTGVRVIPPHPHTGDLVHLQADVKNIGTAPTPDGIVIGGIFLVNGRNICYSDTDKHGLAPGASVTLTSNGGGSNGNGTWPVTEGSWKLKFQVNDNGRFAESNMDNNTFEEPVPLVVTTLPNSDLVVNRVFWKDAEVKAGASIPVFVEVANVGNTATPAGEPVKLTVKEDEKTISMTAPALAPGQSAEVPLADPWTASAGEHKITATISAVSNSRPPGDHASKTLTIAVDKSVTTKALPADSFVDSIGVNVHVSYLDRSYAHFDQLKWRLREMGVRYVRDGASSKNHDALLKLKILAHEGMRCDLLLPPEINDAVAVVKYMGAAPVSLEGPNEPDGGAHDSTFPAEAKRFYMALYNVIKSDTSTKDIPFLDSALAQPNENTAKFGQEPCDIGNIHSYPGTRLPDEGLDQDIAWANQISGGKPIMATETGFTTAVNGISGHPGVSEKAAAKLLPRVYLEDFNRGIIRTFCYEFLDEGPDLDQSNSEFDFGLIRSPNVPKPSFYAMKTLISLLSDSGAAVAPASMTYTINGDVSDLHQGALVKRDGREYLILCVNAMSYDQTAKRDIVVPEQQVTVTFAHPFKKAAIYLPGRAATAQQTMENTQTLKLSVPDELMVVELTPE